jgi:hypothetical protein
MFHKNNGSSADIMIRRLSRHILFFILLAVPVLVYHWKIVFGGHIVCGGDLVNQFVPWREFACNELANGRFPFWNPYVFCGVPFAANIQTSLLYPWNLFNLFLSVERTFSLSLVFHHLLAAVTMYIFLHRLWSSKSGACFGALVYAWSGFFITHAHDGHLIHARAYALLPLALYLQTLLREKPTGTHLSLFALSLAGLFHAGHTQIPLYVFYLLLFRACWWGLIDFKSSFHWKTLLLYPAWTIFGLVLALLLSATVLYPLYELSKQTAGRAGGADYDFAVSDSMPPSHLITFFAPFFYGDPVSADRESRFWETGTGFHEICGYVGVLPLLLLCFAFLPREGSDKRDLFIKYETLFFGLLAIGGILFALGRYNPLYPILYYGLPGWSYFRVPGRLVLLFIIGVSVCSARGLAVWSTIESSRFKNSNYFKLAIVGSVFFIFVLFSLLVSKTAILSFLRELEIERSLSTVGYHANRDLISRQLPDALFEIRYAWMVGSCLMALSFLAAGWCSLWMMRKLKSSYKWLLPFTVLAIDLVFFSHRFFPTQPMEEWRNEYFPQTELITFLQENTKGARVVCLDDAIGHPGLQYHPELRPNRLMHYSIESARGYDPIILNSYSRFTNAMYNRPPETPQGGLLFFSPPVDPNTEEGFNLLNVKYIVTTTYLTLPYKLVWKEEDSPLKIYENPSVRNRFFWESEENTIEPEPIVSTPTHVELKTSSSKPNRLIWSQNYYPGWDVFIDGEPAEIELYRETLMSASIPTGVHRIRFSFTAVPFGRGFGATCLGLVIVIYISRRMRGKTGALPG